VKSVAGIADRRFNALEMLADSEMEKPKAGKGLMMLAGLVILIAGLIEAQSLFIPILIAFFIATVSFPVLNFLRNKGFPRPIAVFPSVGAESI
jgi:predicted PurR-regulated permease PerM